MKKTLPIAIIATSLLGCLSSCQDEDFDVGTAVLQERAFEHSFIKEFGKPSANQSWDFFSQQMEAIRNGAGATRATSAVTFSKRTIQQPKDNDFKALADSWVYSLEEGINNSQTGQNHYMLTSTGTFKIYAVNYGGGIETQSSYGLDFGLIYIDPADGSTHKENLFSSGFNTAQGFGPTYAPPGSSTNQFGNPGWGREVTLTVGTKFYFYLSYTYTFSNNNHPTQTFYSNEIPQFIRRNGTVRSFEELGGFHYYGASTLINTTEHIDETTGKDEQIIMIGFEDAWGLDGNSQDGVPDYDDYDFNDVVILIEGDLPVAENKRFFCEDKSKVDWDYNDVVFDVSNTGITLRAVGGTLPVWLRVTDKNNNIQDYGELHELMGDLQPQEIHQNEKLTFTQLDENGDLQTYYKPIDVGANPGLWLDPVQIAVWKISVDEGVPSTRLGEGELERFANPFADEPLGNVQLIVGSKYGQTIGQAIELATLSSDADDNRPKIVTFPTPGGIPAIWSATTNVRWMKELQKITNGYKNFYGGGEVVNGVPQWWKSGLDDRYWYQFQGDYDPDDPPQSNP